MKPMTNEWIEFAEADWATANREAKVEVDPNYRAVCFHCQQCGEKYLKAYIQEKSIDPDRVHDLEVLLEEILEFESTWEHLRESCAGLTNFAVLHRYPGSTTTRTDAEEAIEYAGLIRRLVREFFQMGN